MGDYEISKHTSNLDNDKGIILVVSNRDQFYFKDRHRNIWLSVLAFFQIDGDSIISNLEIPTHSIMECSTVLQQKKQS